VNDLIIYDDFEEECVPMTEEYGIMLSKWFYSDLPDKPRTYNA
jgi:hypothetical protein